MNYPTERITAADVRVGDRVARARTHEFREVLRLPASPGGYIVLRLGEGEVRIRPRATTKLWRLV